MQYALQIQIAAVVVVWLFFAILIFRKPYKKGNKITLMKVDEQLVKNTGYVAGDTVYSDLNGNVLPPNHNAKIKVEQMTADAVKILSLEIKDGGRHYKVKDLLALDGFSERLNAPISATVLVKSVDTKGAITEVELMCGGEYDKIAEELAGHIVPYVNDLLIGSGARFDKIKWGIEKYSIKILTYN
jgi:hypothetical protein